MDALCKSRGIVNGDGARQVSRSVSTATSPFVISVRRVTDVALGVGYETTACVSFLVVEGVIDDRPLILYVFFGRRALFVRGIIYLANDGATMVRGLVVVRGRLNDFEGDCFVGEEVGLAPGDHSPNVVRYFGIVVVFFAWGVPRDRFNFQVVVGLCNQLVVRLPTSCSKVVSVVLDWLLCRFVDRFSVGKEDGEDVLAYSIVGRNAVFVFGRGFEMFATRPCQ